MHLILLLYLVFMTEWKETHDVGNAKLVIPLFLCFELDHGIVQLAAFLDE